MQKEQLEDDIVRSLLVTVGYLALFTLFIFIPLIGFVMVFTLGAYIAGYRGGRYSVEWKKVAFPASIIWSTIFVILVVVLILPALPFAFDIAIGGNEIMLIILVYLFNIVFCALGARARFKEKAEYL
jgi:hypothetical protein